MFPSNNTNSPFHHHNLNPTYFNQSSSSSSSSLNIGNNNIDHNFFLQQYYHHPHHHFPPGQFLLACVPETTPSAALAAASSNIDSTNLLPERHVKKDRHSKICTSHGLRDRRVRLSIGIARQFFDLQDLLGFDKASNTIEWLLMKSRKAIRKLAESKGNSTGGATKNVSSSDSEFEVLSESDDEEIEEYSDDQEGGLGSKNKLVIRDSVEGKNKAQKTTMQLLAKESRAKARARAKERTREKIHTRKLNEQKESPEQQILNQVSGEFEGSERLQQSAVAEIGDPRGNHQFPRKDAIRESIVITRKIKPASSLNYQPTWMHSKDLNSNSFFSCIPENWDDNGAHNIRPSLSAITSMNPSTEHHHYGKRWEAEDNQHLGL